MQCKHSNHCKQSKQHYCLNICRLFVEVDKYSVSVNNVPITTLLWEPCASERNESSWIRQSIVSCVVYGAVVSISDSTFWSRSDKLPWLKWRKENIWMVTSRRQNIVKVCKISSIQNEWMLVFVSPLALCQHIQCTRWVINVFWKSLCSWSSNTPLLAFVPLGCNCVLIVREVMIVRDLLLQLANPMYTCQCSATLIFLDALASLDIKLWVSE